jgi:hypothetical protein
VQILIGLKIEAGPRFEPRAGPGGSTAFSGADDRT